MEAISSLYTSNSPAIAPDSSTPRSDFTGPVRTETFFRCSELLLCSNTGTTEDMRAAAMLKAAFNVSPLH